MNIQKHEIRRATVTPKNGLEVKFIQCPEEDGIPSNKEYGFKNDRNPHKELFTSFRLLLAHALHISEIGEKIDAKYIKTRQVIDDHKFIKYAVKGFEIKGDDSGEQVRLIMVKQLGSGDKIEMKLPFVKLYDNSSYEFSGNLKDDLSIALAEVLEYMAGKYMESQQYKLEFEEEEF